MLAFLRSVIAQEWSALRRWGEGWFNRSRDLVAFQREQFVVVRAHHMSYKNHFYIYELPF